MYGAGVQAGQNEYLQPLIDGGKILAACETAIGDGNPVSAQSFAQECQRGYGWDRTRIDSTEGAKIWVGHGVLAHNLVKISTLPA
ncbi:hypothetical protein [Rhodococcus sp. IEGM 1307]|uniref:hypothetical protein n=1 Tax=Rhodococcus sp. IEGM 1307 TaxID=3047091 RepID=UPI0024B64DB8|nr:hypothetical protein [Rhodococcus sp. IEGM 1307]MDI9977151.1 hypothetical protein [Rhodococcus sp. IEGM 1307]